MAHKRAWVFQNPKEVERIGTRKAAWCVGWREPDGSRRQRSCGRGSEGKKTAFRMMKRIEAELITGTYLSENETKWSAFIEEYEQTILPTKGEGNRSCTLMALTHFERLVKPNVVENIGHKTLDRFIAKRSLERGKKKGSTISPASVNKELRHIRAVLAIAVEWKYLKQMPSFKRKWLKEPDKLPCFVTPEHFALIYEHCHTANYPEIPHVDAADWWRAFLAMVYMTGWRHSEVYGLRKADLDLEAGTALTRHEDNKGSRDDVIRLHDVVIHHLQKLVTFGDKVFEWPHSKKLMWTQFDRIQQAAGIDLPCDEDHEHTPRCHTYGFHDLRRSFATQNEDNLSPTELQALMRHKSFTTTQRYINMAKKMKGGATEKLFVPDILNQQDGTA